MSTSQPSGVQPHFSQSCKFIALPTASVPDLDRKPGPDDRVGTMRELKKAGDKTPPPVTVSSAIVSRCSGGVSLLYPHGL